MDRRDFIKISSVLTAGSTVLTSCGKDLRQTAAQMVPPDQVVIGEERRLKSACTGCGAGCGVEVRWVDGRAIKLEGIADHPVNRGRLCARGQAELQLLYNPDRIQGPRQGGKDISWDEALKALAEKIKSTDPKQIAFVTPRLTGLRRRLVEDFLKNLGAPPLVEIEPLSEAVVREANRRTTGHCALPSPDYENCNYVLSFGTALLEAGPSPVRAMRGLAHMRQGRPGKRGKLVQIESRYSLTAAYADEWVFVNPGTEGALALAIGHVLGRASEWTPEKAAAITGVPADRIKRLAQEFAGNKPAIALMGGAAAGYNNSLAAAEAVSALNHLNGSYGVSGGLFFESASPVPSSVPRAQLVLTTGNPLYEMPGLAPRPAFLASFSPFPDETAEAAQLLLPSHTTLESWQDTPAKPAVAPMYNTRDWADVLLDLMARLGKKPPAAAENWEAMIQASFASEDEYNAALERGWRQPDAPLAVKKFEFGKTRWEPPQFTGPGELHLQVYAGGALGSGDAANIPWLQELPDPLHQTVWGTTVELNPRTAERLGISDGEMVWVESPKGKVKARVAISPAAPPRVVSIAAGQGHTALGRYARNRGGNVFELVDPAAWAAMRVNLKKS